MDRDEAALLELLRQFLDEELPPEEKTALEDRLRSDKRLLELLQEEENIRRTLTAISKQDIIEFAQKTVNSPVENSRFIGKFSLLSSRLMWAAAVVICLVVGALWLFGPKKKPEVSFSAPDKNQTVLFDQELPVLISRNNPAPSGQKLSVTIIVKSVSHSIYTLEGNELRVEIPPGFWPTPLRSVEVFQAENRTGILLRVDQQFYVLSPASVPKSLPSPDREK